MSKRQPTHNVIEIGIIGCGGVVEGLHLPALQSTPGTLVKWVCDSSPGRARTIARLWGIKQYFSDLAECSDVDAVLIATPVGSRRSILALTTERGWHALCEKPFAVSTKEHEEMNHAALRAGVTLGAGYMRRQYWTVKKAQQLVQSRALGKLVQIIASEPAVLGRTGIEQSSYRNDSQASGGGVLTETGSHLVDEIMFISGAESCEIEQCEQKVWDGYEVETVAFGTITTRVAERIHLQCTVSGVDPVFPGIAFRCESGEILLRLDPSKGLQLLVGADRSQGVEIPHPNPSANHVLEAFRAEWIHFLQEIRQHGTWNVHENTGLLTTDVIMQCRELATSPSCAGRV